MRKMMIAAVALLACCVTSFATISVDWFALYNIKLSGGVTDLPIGSIAELIWSADNSINPIDPFDPLTPQGGEVLLLNFTTTGAGEVQYGTANYMEADYGFADPDTNHFANGYVYTRVFNFLAADGTPTGGTWYGEGGLAGPVPSQHTAGTPPDPTVCDITELGAGPFTLDQQIAIPEPATWVLGFLGLGVLLRRRLMRK